MDITSSNIRKKPSPEDYVSSSVNRNAFAFGIIMLFLQIGVCLIYGFLIKVPTAQTNISSSFITIGLSLLIIAGFGLVFGYSKRLIWSGIGFTFFITALCIEIYPLVNDFWTKTGIQSNNKPSTDFNFDRKNFNLYLTNRETGSDGTTAFYGNSITNALKCALSIAVAFSSVLGRAGHLECLIVTAFGIIGFELNRQIIQQNQGIDTFGTFFIFTFGGFMGFGLGLLSYIRQQNKQGSKLGITSIKRYDGSNVSTLHATFGALIIFSLFPLLSYEFDAYSRYQQFSPYTNPVCILLGLGAGTIGATLTSLLINGSVIIRDALHGSISGAIVVGASSLYITNPVYALVAGCTGGIIQALIQDLIESYFVKKNIIVSTVSWSLFGFEGIVGAGFASGWQAILFTFSSSSLPTQNGTLAFSSQFQFYGGLISAGIGCAFGLFIGFIIILVNSQKSQDYFEDWIYWMPVDGIKYYDGSQPSNIKQPAKQQQKLPSDKSNKSFQQQKSVHGPQNANINNSINVPEQENPLPPMLTQISDEEIDYSIPQHQFRTPYAFL